MINSQDVITMLVPFPNISSKLAKSSHMYICKDSSHPHYSFIKCQTLKPKMLIHSPIRHYVDEIPDLSRNPFISDTRIDCDKLFRTDSVTYEDCLKTSIRPDVCDDLYVDVINELMEDGYLDIPINEHDLVYLNWYIHY